MMEALRIVASVVMCICGALVLGFAVLLFIGAAIGDGLPDAILAVGALVIVGVALSLSGARVGLGRWPLRRR